MAEILIVHRRTREEFTVLIDDEDHRLLKHFNWFLCNGYAAAQKVYLHRVIMDPEPGMVVDHINRNKLDNRRENLRVVTHQENLQNQRSQVGKTSEYRGVSWIRGAWVAQCRVNGETHYLGRHTDEMKAAAIARETRLRLMSGAVD